MFIRPIKDWKSLCRRIHFMIFGIRSFMHLCRLYFALPLIFNSREGGRRERKGGRARKNDGFVGTNKWYENAKVSRTTSFFVWSRYKYFYGKVLGLICASCLLITYIQSVQITHRMKSNSKYKFLDTLMLVLLNMRGRKLTGHQCMEITDIKCPVMGICCVLLATGSIPFFFIPFDLVHSLKCTHTHAHAMVGQ